MSTNILLTNDDGYTSPAFFPLLKTLAEEFNVTAVVPASEQSWIGKAISRSATLTFAQKQLGKFEIHTVNGTPADCVQIGLYDLCDLQPQLVVSGINTELNTGIGRILSSGTLGGRDGSVTGWGQSSGGYGADE